MSGDMGKPMKCDSFIGESHGKYGKIMMNIDEASNCGVRQPLGAGFWHLVGPAAGYYQGLVWK